MNRTQKETIVNLICMLFNIGIVFYLFVSLFVLKRLPGGFDFFCVLVAVILILIGVVIFLRRKQSPTETDSDERDGLIKKRAVMVSFVSGWLLLAAASVIPRFVVGVDGMVPVWLLPIINITVFLLAMVVYCVAVLVQYGLENKGEKS